MTREELTTLHEELCEKAKGLMVRKNHDYTAGSESPFSNFQMSSYLNVEPEIGLMLRMLDKIKRIETFVKQGTLQVQSESATDSVLDLINYAVLLQGLMIKRQENTPK